MKYALLIAACIFSINVLSGQIIYVSSSFNDIFRLDLDDCSNTLVTNVNRQVYDIAFHPNGTLYGISGNGNFYSIDTLNGSTVLIHDFAGQVFNSLTIASDGLVYTTGTNGELWTYNLMTNTATALGFIGFGATGDLTFYNGELYVACSGDRIVKIPLDMVSNSYVVINDDIPGNILGIVSDVVNCTEVNSYAITNGDSDIYKINFETNSLDLVCELNITVGGGASTSEFLGSSPLKIDTTLLIHPDCTQEKGEASIYVSGGSGIYSYSLNGGLFQSSNSFKALDPGSYFAIVRDQRSCEDTIDFTLNTPEQLMFDSIIIDHTSCGFDNGQIVAYISGGNGLVQFSLDSIQFTADGFFEGLPPHTYTLFAQDSAGCVIKTEVVIDSSIGPAIVQIDITHMICNDVFPGSVRIYAEPANGLLYSYDGVDFYPYNGFGVFIGTYLATIQDENGCRDTMTFEMTFLGTPQITHVSTLPETCGNEDGAMTISVIEGTSPYQYSLDGFTYQTDSTFSNLAAGNYSVYILDAGDCNITTEVVISSLGDLTFSDIESSPSICGEKTGTIRITAEGGVSPFVFSLNDTISQSEALFTDLSAGTYHVHIEDAAGCILDTTVILDQTACDKNINTNIYIPNIFSPNGDGNNDIFQISTSDKNEVLITRFFIFDRWGNSVYEKYNMPIQSAEGWWDGTYKRFTMNPGVFAYYLEVEFAGGQRETFKGNVTLIR